MQTAASALAGAIAMAVAMGLGRFLYTPILPGMIDSLGLSASAAGAIASANYLGYLAGALGAAFGWATGRERSVATAALAATVALLGAMALAETVAAFVAIRFLAGIASAFVMVFTTSIVLGHALILGDRSAQPIHFGGVGAGILVSALAVGALSLSGFGWQSGWQAGAMLGLFGLLIVWRLLPRSPSPMGRGRPEPPLVWTRAFIGLTAAYGLFGFGYIDTATFLVTIVRAGSASPGLEAAVWFVTGLAALPSVAYWMPVVRWRGPMAVFTLGCAVEAAGVAASVVVPPPVGPLMGGVMLGGTFVMITAYGLQIGRQMAADSPRRAIAIMTAAFGVGQITGPVAAGFLADWTGSFTLASLLAAVALLAAALIGFRLDSGESRSVLQ